jgi:RNA polymerase sigma-70 factor (sigma-E family)
VSIELVVGRTRKLARIEDLYDAHMTSAVRFAYLISGDEHLAQDLAHDGFLQASSKLGALRSPENFPAYLRSAIFNGYRSHFRKQRRERAYITRNRPGIPHPVEGPDFDTRDEIKRALTGLPSRRRAAVILRYYEDMTEQQTAEVLGCSVGAVKALVARGLTQLRAALEGVVDDRTE